jgi:hypothetical protein
MGEDDSVQEAGSSAKKPKYNEPHLKSKMGTNQIMNSKTSKY